MSGCQLHLGDCMHILPALPNASVDAIITDPPYGVFERELKFDQLPAAEVWRECYRVAKPNAWLAASGQMPTLATMHQQILDAGWRWREHIVWLRRHYVPLPGPLMRGHESILLYTKGSPRMHDIRAPWWDCRLPLLPWGGIDIGSLQRAIAEMRYLAKHGKWRSRSLPAHSRQQPNPVHCRRYPKNTLSMAYDAVNIGNVWSFSGDLHKSRLHPHQKPLALMERLVKLLTAEGDTVLDPFMGVGTTGVAAVRLGRAFIGIEIESPFFALAQHRIAEALQQPQTDDDSSHPE